jgi:hypothetical protein
MGDVSKARVSQPYSSVPNVPYEIRQGRNRPQKSMKVYKHQLAMVNQRYGSIELRVLEFFVKGKAPVEIQILTDMVLFIQNLLDDKLLADAGKDQPIANGELIRKTFVLTQNGKDYIKHWLAAESA